MKLTRSFVSLSLSFFLVFVSFLSFSIQSVNAQDTKIALQRGYRTGYSDGYMSGYRDSIENSSRGMERHGDYAKADRLYNKEYGAAEDYRDGYQQGFEIGYNTGFDKRSFDAALPTDIKRRGTIKSGTSVGNTSQTVPSTPTTQVNPADVVTVTRSETDNVSNVSQSRSATQNNSTVNFIPTSNNYDDQVIVIPVDTELVVEILGDLNTSRSRVGDKFQARVITPSEISGAIVEGRVTDVKKPGKIKRRAEISLTFDQIRLTETRWANYSAILTDVLPVSGDNIKQVDVEGTVKGKSSMKKDGIKVGATTGTGLVIGAIAGGPVGAAVGAGIGAAVGVGSVIIDKGNQINIVRGQQLRIKTTYETQIR